MKYFAICTAVVSLVILITGCNRQPSKEISIKLSIFPFIEDKNLKKFKDKFEPFVLPSTAN